MDARGGWHFGVAKGRGLSHKITNGPQRNAENT